MSLDEYAPTTDDEHKASAAAVFEHRRAEEGDALVDALSDREKRLIELAWAAGARHARAKMIAKLETPLAVTLDAAAVHKAMREIDAAPRALVIRDRYVGLHYDQRLVDIVRTLDAAEALERGEARRGDDDTAPY